jgi:hypothetical protein
MSKYRITKDDLIEILLYMDISGKKIKCYSRKEAEELQEQKIKGKQIKLNIISTVTERSEEQKKETEDLEKEIAELKKSPIDLSLIEEKTFWKKPDGFEDEFINEQGWERNEVTGAVKYNSGKHRRAIAACLLKGWTLEKEDPALKLEFTAMPGSQKKMILLPKTMEAIWEMDKEIISTLMNEAYRKIFGDDLLKK